MARYKPGAPDGTPSGSKILLRCFNSRDLMNNCRVVARLRKLKEDVGAPRGQQSGKYGGQREEIKFLEL